MDLTIRIGGLANLENKLLTRTTTILDDIASRVTDTVRRSSPVDTGFLRYNWYWTGQPVFPIIRGERHRGNLSLLSLVPWRPVIERLTPDYYTAVGGVLAIVNFAPYAGYVDSLPFNGRFANLNFNFVGNALSNLGFEVQRDIRTEVDRGFVVNF